MVMVMVDLHCSCNFIITVQTNVPSFLYIVPIFLLYNSIQQVIVIQQSENSVTRHLRVTRILPFFFQSMHDQCQLVTRGITRSCRIWGQRSRVVDQWLVRGEQRAQQWLHTRTIRTHTLTACGTWSSTTSPQPPSSFFTGSTSQRQKAVILTHPRNG